MRTCLTAAGVGIEVLQAMEASAGNQLTVEALLRELLDTRKNPPFTTGG